MREIALVVLVGTAGALAFACSSHTFSSSSRDGGADGGGSNTGGSPSAGGASGSAGSLQTGGASSTGGAKTTGGASGTGATGGASGTGASPATGGLGATGGRQGTGGTSGISRDGGEGSLDAGAVRCTGADPTFPTIDKGCSTSADCVVVRHKTSCCGSGLLMGINHGDLARFQAAESICDAQYPACGCASFGVDVEDGTVLPSGSENLAVASCDNMVCRSHYSGKTFACGTKTCTDQQSCTESSGGPAGTPTSYSCNQLGNCKSCACVSPSTTAGCTCSDGQGFVKITCQRS
jgi:hypothetical protein